MQCEIESGLSQKKRRNSLVFNCRFRPSATLLCKPSAGMRLRERGRERRRRSAESRAPPNKFGGGESARTVDVRSRLSRKELDRAHTSAELGDC
jgi:hypothetical protein